MTRWRPGSRGLEGPGCVARAAPVLAGLALGLAAGCTRESARIALDAQRRADEVQQAVFERQHAALRVLLYRDLVRRLEEGGAPLTDAQRDAIGAAWNDRDLIEFWHVQHERAKALRRAGVDAQLWGSQAALDLLIKATEARLDRARTGLATYAGAVVFEGTEPGLEGQGSGGRGAAPTTPRERGDDR